MKRIIYLDNLRIFLISYVIVGHISVAYGAIGRGNWYYVEPVNDMLTKAVLYLVDMLAYSFLMVMFIFIAGYFTPASYERKGFLLYLKDRVVRLLIPLLLYYFILGPVVKYISMLAKGETTSSLTAFFAEMYSSGVYGYMGVMWFVELLIAFSFLYAVFKRFFPNGFFPLKSDSFPSDKSILYFILALGAASFGARMLFPMGGGYLAARPLASFVLFASAFFLGTLAWKYDWLEKLTDATAWKWFWVALVFMILPMILFIALKKTVGFSSVKGAGSVGSLLYAYWEVIKCVGTGLLSVVIFRKYFDRQGRIAAAMGRSAFAAYVLHPIICVLIMYALAGVHFHPLIKFALVAPTALAATFSISWLFIQIPGVNKIF
ncbi:MAG: acyltransferase family protein [Bacteroidales bacterium]|nr:acyltransferase family protein [Bacteroidales bacterium]